MSFLDSDEDPKLAKRRPLLFFLLATLAVGTSASVFTEPNITGWYAGLAHPSFAPPNWVFAPVWTTLYVVMAVAAWRVWKLRPASPARGALVEEVVVAGPGGPSAKRSSGPFAGPTASEDRWGLKNIEMFAYAVQLLFNFAWSAIFFAAHRIGLAFIEICILLVLILATTILFWRRDPVAGLLFLPYLAWTAFAAALNDAFWALNP
ncbi:MAG TPA: TspO/MBR family protein [Rhizomicrobium sp.]|jgi:tryptophan-rich sensory protein|nr:TspO/MBR family protein [Rhizomicrobium sp.]